MNERLLIAATLGWSPQLITAPLTRRLSPQRTITLHLLYIEPGPGEDYARTRIEETIDEIKTLAKHIENLAVKASALPRQEPGRLAVHMAEALSPEAREADTIHILAAGGPRLLATTAALLAAAASALNPRIQGYVVEEDTRTEHQIPQLPLSLPQGEAKREIAAHLVKLGETTYNQLAEVTGKDPVTVKRLLNELAKTHYITCTRKARKTTCRPTPTLYLAHAAQHLAQQAQHP